MTKKEVSINTKWDEFEIGTCRVFVDVLKLYIPVLFFQDHKPRPTVSNTMMQALNDILDMPLDEFDRLPEILGMEDGTNIKLKEIHIDQDNDVYEGVYSEVIIDTAAKTQVSVIVKDGAFICVNEGAYFDTLEVMEKKSEAVGPSKEEKQKIIDMMMSSE